MDTAEHMFAKSVRTHQVMKSSAAESFADLLYEMGRDLLRQRNYELAIKWLNRAHDMIGAQDLEQLSSEAGELRLSIMQSISEISTQSSKYSFPNRFSSTSTYENEASRVSTEGLPYVNPVRGCETSCLHSPLQGS
jgi:hypothetical protein